jgi:hypothetical protein
MAWHVHEVDIRIANELDFGRIKETVVVLTDESRILDGLLSELPDVCFGADDADIIWMRALALIC